MLGWVVLALVAMVVAAAWTLVPSILKARYGINEIVTTLMMSFIGVSCGQPLVKGPFKGEATVPQTERRAPSRRCSRTSRARPSTSA